MLLSSFFSFLDFFSGLGILKNINFLRITKKKFSLRDTTFTLPYAIL